MNKDVGALVANIGGDFDQRRDDRLGVVLIPVSATLEVLIRQLILPNCFTIAFWALACEGFAFSF